MIKIQDSIIIDQHPKKVYEFVKRLDFFPKFIAGVELVSFIKKKNNEVLSHWWINFKGVSLRWKEINSFDDENLSLHFSLVEGDFLKYDGMWRVVPMNDKACVLFSVTIDWNSEHKASFKVPDLERKTRLGIRWMLKCFRKGFDPRKILSSDEMLEGNVVISELFSFKKENDQKIVGYFDHMREISQRAPFVIVVPGYGETKRDSLFIAYFLAKNGFNVIRYDATDHVGESAGDILGTTLEKNKQDLVSVIDYIGVTYGINKVGVVASSMGSRAALKATSEDNRIISLITVSGVVDVRATLKAVYFEDMIGNVIEGKQKETYDVLGHIVNNDFFHAAIKYGYDGLSSTKNDLEKIHAPITAIVGDKDVWVNANDVKKVYACEKNPQRRVVTINNAMHKLFENPEAAQMAMKYIVTNAIQDMSCMTMSLEHVIEPRLREIAIQNKVEKTRSRFQTKRTTKEEQVFWDEYIDDFAILQKFDDYKSLLNSSIALLSLKWKKSRILDAGCGVGYLTICVMLYLMQNVKKDSKVSGEDIFFHFECIDFIENNLKKARLNNNKVNNAILQDLQLKRSFFDFHYSLIDLNKRLPFEDNTFDYVCSNLVISYLKNPLVSLQELFRVLKPNGKIVISTLKPFADLSQIYRNFVSSHPEKNDIEGARKLLSSAGQINTKEGEGHYFFYSQEELKEMIKSLGGRGVKTIRAFGDQANVIVANK